MKNRPHHESGKPVEDPIRQINAVHGIAHRHQGREKWHLMEQKQQNSETQSTVQLGNRVILPLTVFINPNDVLFTGGDYFLVLRK